MKLALHRWQVLILATVIFSSLNENLKYYNIYTYIIHIDTVDISIIIDSRSCDLEKGQGLSPISDAHRAFMHNNSCMLNYVALKVGQTFQTLNTLTAFSHASFFGLY